MNRSNLFAVCLACIFLTAQASAYKIWLGTHKWEGSGADNLSQWDMAIDKIDGINYVLLDARPARPAGEGASTSDWRAMITPIDQSIPGMAEIARSQYAPGHSRTLAERMENEFATARNNGGYEIDVIMLYDEEAANGTLSKYNLADVQGVRAWLDSNGHADVSIVFRLTNNDQERLSLVQQSVVDGVLIEASATRWVENRNNLHTLLQDLWTDPSTSYKNIYFQIPRHETPGTLNQRDGIPTSPINQYIETRRALWVIKDLMGDAFMQSDQAIFIVCNYGDTYDTYPETENADTRYVDTKSGLALSLIEQRLIFEGRTGVVNEALCSSYARYEVSLAPDSGLVAHWPLNGDSGITATDESGYGSDGTLLNGPMWASDETRGSYVVFDGVNDLISTPFTYKLASDDDFTWAWWANKADPVGAKSGSIMVGNRYGNSGSETYEFIKLTPASGQFANTNSIGNIEGYNYPDITNDGWHHYAMVKSGTSYQWYVDGAPQGGPVTINYNESSPLPFFIGGDNAANSNEHFSGGIDDVVLYRSALNQHEISNVINGIYYPEITMIALGSPVDSTAGSTWSDSLPAHDRATYVVPSTGNLRGESGSTVFPGNALIVQAGGKFQVRAIEDDVTTVNHLILQGGAGFGAGQFAELAAGTGTAVTNVIDGRITQSGATRLVTYGGATARKLKVLSEIEGDGTLQVTGEGAIINDPENSFSGTWEVAADSTLVFEHAGAVGTADVEVQSAGMLEIKGGWLQNAMLTVANVAGTEVKVGPNEWKVSSLILGGTPVADGIYSPSELSGLGNVLFSGTGRVTVGTPVFAQELVAGWDTWTSNTAPLANVTGSGITATATASTATGNWNTADDSSSGRGSSGDTTWGSFGGKGSPASAVTTGTGSNMTASNGVVSAELTLTITNNGAADWDLDALHMDVVAFRSNAPRTYQLEVISGDISNGIVFSSSANEITELGGNLSATHDQHDEIDVSLIGLADSTLEAGETAVLRITFSGGTGSGGGHHLFLDNVAVSGVVSPVSAQQAWRFEHFGTIENSGVAADSFDANFDGEDNLHEFATGQNPHSATLAQTGLSMNGGDLEFRYTRSKAALADGVNFQVEWSDTLLEGTWSTSQVNDALDTENPGDSEVENRVATIPVSNAGRRFAHLKVTP